jgi:hypothetical protein
MGIGWFSWIRLARCGEYGLQRGGRIAICIVGVDRPDRADDNAQVKSRSAGFGRDHRVGNYSDKTASRAGCQGLTVA